MFVFQDLDADFREPMIPIWKANQTSQLAPRCFGKQEGHPGGMCIPVRSDRRGVNLCLNEPAQDEGSSERLGKITHKMS